MNSTSFLPKAFIHNSCSKFLFILPFATNRTPIFLPYQSEFKVQSQQYLSRQDLFSDEPLHQRYFSFVIHLCKFESSALHFRPLKYGFILQGALHSE
jgi:hypothetical protein